MKVKISRHNNKIKVIVYSPSDVIQLGTSLRSDIGKTDVLAIKGGYLIPSSAIAVIARKFPPNDNEWEEELNLRALQILHTTQAQSAAKKEVAQALEAPFSALKEYKELWRLDPHQVEAVAAMTVSSLEGMALFDEQGSGKTICALASFDILRQKGIISHLLVVAPKSVLPVWKNEIDNFLKDRYFVVIIEGKKAKPFELLRNLKDIMLISYEAVTRGSVILQGLASTGGREFMLVVDESYYVKNPAAKRSKAVAQLRQLCKRAYVLCGTPAPNSPIDVVHQIDITDAGTTFTGVDIPKDEISAATIIQEALGDSAIYLRRLKEEVLPLLPPKLTKKVFIELQPVQAYLYKKFLQGLVIDVRQVDDTYFKKHLAEFMARRWALFQVCSNPGAIDPLYSEVPAKLLALDQILKTIVEDSGLKIIIWSFFRYSLEAITRRYAHYGIVRIDGSVDSIEERAIAVHRFQNDSSVKIFVGNPAAAGAGITLTAASHAIYESFSNQPAHYLQSIDRIHRRGQNSPVVTYFVLISQSTIEQREFDKLIDKERRGYELFGKQPIKTVTREGFLKDLIGE